MFDQNLNRVPNPPTARLHCTKTVRDILAATPSSTETQLDQQAIEQLGRRYRDLDRTERLLVQQAFMDERCVYIDVRRTSMY